jgi:hypothetical protein
LQKALIWVAGVVLALSAAAPASADQQRVVSQPNGHFTLIVESRSETDKDRDGNPDTATQPDNLFSNVDVFQRFGQPQIVQLEIMVDRPGDAFDERFTRTADLVTFVGAGFAVRDRVTKKWGLGEYTVTARATSDTGDTATASASLTVH